MAGPQGSPSGVWVSCACCDKRVFRMHGLIVLLRNGKRGVSFRLTCVGYCAEHFEDAIDVALDAFRGHGQLVTFGVPDVVRPNRQLQWRRAVVARLTAACQEMLASSVLVGAPPYPEEPVTLDEATVGPSDLIDLDEPRAGSGSRRAGAPAPARFEPEDLLRARRRP